MASKSHGLAELIQRDGERLDRLYNFIKKGVNIIDPFTTYISEKVAIGKGTTIYPLTYIEPGVKIGKNCQIGPFARIRKGTRIKDTAAIGNFVEVVRSTISEGSKAKHLTYLGDALIDKKVNIGAGTIIANYDGKEKHLTRIKEGAFVGSGSILVAPVKIGRRAITGAGAVVTKNRHVADNTVVVGIPAKVFKKNKE
ncbi:MAG: hypothetical protein JW788_01510 [Candidatus Omnitrophica bacterium]|nr:hypothetical protein [Candidatus Omnitrophota bacterium]